MQTVSPTTAPWTVAVIDSGVSRHVTLPADRARSFHLHEGRIEPSHLVPDPSGHGTRVSSIILSAKAPIELMIGQVFTEVGGTSAAAVAAAVEWAVGHRARLVHLSLGLRVDRTVLREAIARAVSAGTLVVASTPAQGQKTFPAKYPGVIAATGDARCAPDSLTSLQTEQAEFGGCVRYDHEGASRLGGASIGAAHVTRFIVENLSPALPTPEVRQRLVSLAAYHGREFR